MQTNIDISLEILDIFTRMSNKLGVRERHYYETLIKNTNTKEQIVELLISLINEYRIDKFPLGNRCTNEILSIVQSSGDLSEARKYIPDAKRELNPFKMFCP